MVMVLGKHRVNSFSLETVDGKCDFCAKDTAEKQQWMNWFSSTEIRRESLRGEKAFFSFIFILSFLSFIYFVLFSFWKTSARSS